MNFRLKSTFLVIVIAFVLASTVGEPSLHKPVHPFAKDQADLIFKKHYPAIMVLLEDHDEGISMFEIATQLSP